MRREQGEHTYPVSGTGQARKGVGTKRLIKTTRVVAACAVMAAALLLSPGSALALALYPSDDTYISNTSQTVNSNFG